MNSQTESRFWKKVDKRGADDCWPWLGSTACEQRYGRFYVAGRMVPAHRYAWELHHGEKMLPQFYACHVCDNPICVNPAHIWPGTPRENMVDAHRKGRASVDKGHETRLPWKVCKHGHPMEGSNVYVNPTTGVRKCWQCKIAYDRKRRAAA